MQELVDEIEKILQKEEQCRESIEEKQDYEIEVLDKVMNCFEKKFLKLFQESVYMKNPFSEKKAKSDCASLRRNSF